MNGYFIKIMNQWRERTKHQSCDGKIINLKKRNAVETSMLGVHRHSNVEYFRDEMMEALKEKGYHKSDIRTFGIGFDVCLDYIIKFKG